MKNQTYGEFLEEQKKNSKFRKGLVGVLAAIALASGAAGLSIYSRSKDPKTTQHKSAPLMTASNTEPVKSESIDETVLNEESERDEADKFFDFLKHKFGVFKTTVELYGLHFSFDLTEITEKIERQSDAFYSRGGIYINSHLLKQSATEIIENLKIENFFTKMTKKDLANLNIHENDLTQIKGAYFSTVLIHEVGHLFFEKLFGKNKEDVKKAVDSEFFANLITLANGPTPYTEMTKIYAKIDFPNDLKYLSEDFMKNEENISEIKAKKDKISAVRIFSWINPILEKELKGDVVEYDEIKKVSNDALQQCFRLFDYINFKE